MCVAKKIWRTSLSQKVLFSDFNGPLKIGVYSLTCLWVKTALHLGLAGWAGG